MIDDELDDSGDQSFTYDSVGRLTGVRSTEDNLPVVYGWTYDLVGNRTSEAVTVASSTPATSTYAYVAGSNQLASIGSGGTTTHAFTQQADGATSTDTISSVTRTYGYDRLGRLASVSEGGSTVGNYGYDGLSRLVSREIGTARRRAWCCLFRCWAAAA